MQCIVLKIVRKIKINFYRRINLEIVRMGVERVHIHFLYITGIVSQTL